MIILRIENLQSTNLMLALLCSYTNRLPMITLPVYNDNSYIILFQHYIYTISIFDCIFVNSINSSTIPNWFTHCSLMTPSGIRHLGHHRFCQWTVASWTSGLCLNQYGLIVNCILMETLPWNFDPNHVTFFSENAFETIVWTKIGHFLHTTIC